MSPARHPNRLAFKAVLTRIDEPSDKPPSDSRGHRVLLTEEAAVEALESLIGMGVGFKTGWDGHDARRKCGVITEAWIAMPDLCVRGYIYCHDFPEVGAQIRELDMGMSYEIMDAHIRNMTAEVWRMEKVTFTGAAILLRLKAAYTSSSIEIEDAA